VGFLLLIDPGGRYFEIFLKFGFAARN